MFTTLNMTLCNYVRNIHAFNASKRVFQLLQQICILKRVFHTQNISFFKLLEKILECGSNLSTNKVKITPDIEITRISCIICLCWDLLKTGNKGLLPPTMWHILLDYSSTVCCVMSLVTQMSLNNKWVIVIFLIFKENFEST